MTPDRLNLLFITIDQLRADVVAGALHGIVPTPALDRLAAEGTSFDAAFTAAVPCGPARASLMTGLHAFNHRSVRNGAPLGRQHASLGTELRRLGREPLLFGYGDIGPDPGAHHPADPDMATYELPAPGFREVVNLRFEAPMDWIAHLRRKGYHLPGPQPDRWYDLHRSVGGGITDPALYRAEDSDTAFLTDRLLEALDARRDGVWTAHATYIRPHPPFVAPAPWNRLADPRMVPGPVTAAATHPFRDAWFSEPAARGLWMGFDGNVAALSAQQVAALRAVYLGLVAEVDHHLGRVLDWLDATGLADRTLVIVMADHGEMLGDQGYWGKDTVFAAAHRVPMILRGPGVMSGHRVAGPICTTAVAPTILSALGGAVPVAMDGPPLQPLLAGSSVAPDAFALTEIDLAHPRIGTRFQRFLGLSEHCANAATLREARWTLVHFNGGLPPLLFDRQTDPDETRDLAAEPGADAEIARLRARMLDHRMTRADRRLTGWSIGA
ncbi:sulfatase-like hydrolase/transferase [Gemmobacter sp.]|uniref:sulfatase-like hydrolase/transferase n=1 Tax=Gemmobacter sp. TaxID=1898957 RepID=UPI002AFEF6DA|nr:sulfatase-like hydrolase/transferase [Gemmobacter sp.]